MNTLFNLVVVVQVLSALAIIALVLLQHGKGADMGAAFGSGASGSLFGATGSSNFMSKSTGVAAAIFFSATLALSYMANERTSTVGGGVMDKVTVPVAPTGAGAIPKATTAPAAAPAAGAPAASAAVPAATAPAASTPAGQIPK
jgi:preprotein translocase subunit SecG